MKKQWYEGCTNGNVLIVRPRQGVLDWQYLPPRQDLRNHSPDGFSWGYSGSGPAQLALALLAHALRSDTEAERHYQQFKDERIAHLPQGKPWKIAQEEIVDWWLSAVTCVADLRCSSGWRNN